MSRRSEANRIVATIDAGVRADLADDPRSAIEVHYGFTVVAATSFEERGANGWCDGMSETKSGIILYRQTLGRRENFTLAHELAHHLIDEDDDCLSWIADQPEPARLLEEVCDDIASQILITDEAFARALDGGKPRAETVAALYESTVASRTACLIAVARRLPCEGFALLVDPEDPSRVFAGSRAAKTRPYAWKGDTIPQAHVLCRGSVPPAQRSWWPDWRGDRREYYATFAGVDGYLCAVFAENDLWDVEEFHGYTEVPPDRGNDGDVNCPTCGHHGKTRWWPCPTCKTLSCPKCGECECTRREKREKRTSCQNCFQSVRAHLLDENGFCDNCR